MKEVKVTKFQLFALGAEITLSIKPTDVLTGAKKENGSYDFDAIVGNTVTVVIGMLSEKLFDSDCITEKSEDFINEIRKIIESTLY